MRALFIAAVRSVATYVVVSLYVFVTGIVGMLLATLFGWTDLLYIFGHGGVRLGCALGLVNGLIAEAAQAIKECGRLLVDD